MKNGLYTILVFLLLLNCNAKADEGMWIPSLVGKLNIQKMNEIGCKMTPDQIYSINNSCIKDAVVALDRGSCTAELISADGLLLTNHHCGFDQIQDHSSVEHDYLKDGFWARTREDELSNPGKTVTFLIRMEDVTEQVLKNVKDDMDEQTRSSNIQKAISKIEKEAQGETAFETNIKSLFESNKFYLFVSQTFNDVRLVGAPPQSIGKFGGESDNWVWPRHTGDFSMFRVYCSPEGKPANYSKENVPYHPKYFFPISLKGVGANDFTMVMGYPGRTNRYKTSKEIENIMDVDNEAMITARAAKLKIIREYMVTSEKARIQYASKLDKSSNYYKYSIGQNQGLKRLNVIDRKEALEKSFLSWVNDSAARKAKYGGVLDSINAPLVRRDERIAYDYMNEALVRGAEIFSFAARSSALYAALKGTDKDKIRSASEEIRNSLPKYFKDYDSGTDMKIAGALLKIYSEKVSPKYIPDFFHEINSKFKGDFEAYTKKLFEKSIFASQEKMESFLNKPSRKVLDKDMAFNAMRSMFLTQYSIMRALGNTKSHLDRAKRLYLAGLMEMHRETSLYPDANSTMRLTYGTVNGYIPRDAVFYDFFTTLKGYKEKGIRGDVDFDYPQKLIDMYNENDYGPYADKDGTLHTCFISNNDITGGNSGSPVISTLR